MINALIIAVMIIAFLVHEATAMWDVRYATTARIIGPVEQHVDSFLEMILLMGLVSVVSLHWGQFLALFGLGGETARFDLERAAPVGRQYRDGADRDPAVRAPSLSGGIRARATRQ